MDACVIGTMWRSYANRVIPKSPLCASVETTSKQSIPRNRTDVYPKTSCISGKKREQKPEKRNKVLKDEVILFSPRKLQDYA